MVVTDRPDRPGRSPLMRAAHEGRADDVARLIAEGARLDDHAKYGLSALMLAVIAGHHEVVELRYGSGAGCETIAGVGCA